MCLQRRIVFQLFLERLIVRVATWKASDRWKSLADDVGGGVCGGDLDLVCLSEILLLGGEWCDCSWSDAFSGMDDTL
jgi:hypothetical protein